MKQKDFLMVCLSFICVTTFYSQIVNEGILKIESSTIVYFGEEYTNKSTATHTNNGNLYLNSNFINDGATASVSGTTFFSSSSNTIQTISGLTKNVNFYNLEINITTTGKKGVSVADNFGLYVENGVNLVNGDLRLVGESQLIQNHVGNSANLSTNGKLHKDQQGFKSAYGYNHWSSPVNNGGVFKLNGGLFDGTDASVNSFSSQQVLFNSGSPYNGLPSVIDGSGNVTTPLTINERWLYKFSRGGINSYADWIKIDKNSEITPGEGYLMKGTNTTSSQQNYVFKGVPNDGAYSFIVGANESHLFGNPYPCALDSEKFINDNLSVFDGTLYFWVEGNSPSHYLSDYLGGYATFNLTTGVSASLNTTAAGIGNANTAVPTRYMAVGQGFFIDTNANGSIDFDNSQRVFKTESLGESIHYKGSKSKSAGTNSIIRLSYRNPEGFDRELALGFLPSAPANLNYNPGYDAIMTGERKDELFFIIDNDLSKKYVIQGVGAFDEAYEFPLGLKITEIGAHSISLKGVENFTNNVYLKDKIVDTIHNLSNQSYTINLPSGIYLDRFSLVFRPADAVIVEEDMEEVMEEVVEEQQGELVLEGIKAFYNGNKEIVLLKRGDNTIKEIKVFNVLGQPVQQITNKYLGETNISIPFNKSKGMYFVQVQSDLGTKIIKILN